MIKTLFFLAIFIPLGGFSKCIINKNIPYKNETDPEFNSKRNILDIYVPKKNSSPAPVLVFIHGGSWNSGNKNTYKFFGKGMASKGILTVIINYRLSPEAGYLQMGNDCAAAVKWVYENISKYGGDRNDIYVSGHSAGGHLAALISNDPQYFETQKINNPLRACLLIDPFGLDMYNYFPTSTYSKDASFKVTFTEDSLIWKKASPYFYINSKTIPHLLWIGEKTYPSIITQGDEYYKSLTNSGISTKFETIKNKGHIGMIFQFVRRSNPQYKKVLTYIDQTKK